MPNHCLNNELGITQRPMMLIQSFFCHVTVRRRTHQQQQNATVTQLRSIILFDLYLDTSLSWHKILLTELVPQKLKYNEVPNRNPCSCRRFHRSLCSTSQHCQIERCLKRGTFGRPSQHRKSSKSTPT